MKVGLCRVVWWVALSLALAWRPLATGVREVNRVLLGWVWKAEVNYLLAKLAKKLRSL